MLLAILFQFLCTQHVSDINISIIRSLRLCCWIIGLLFLVCCVLEIWCGWIWVVSVLKAEAQLVVLQPGLITRPEESYRLWCFVVCDLETSWMKRPRPTGGCSAKTRPAVT